MIKVKSMHDHTFSSQTLTTILVLWLIVLLRNYFLLESPSSCSLCPMLLLFVEDLARGEIEVKKKERHYALHELQM